MNTWGIRIRIAVVFFLIGIFVGMIVENHVHPEQYTQEVE